MKWRKDVNLKAGDDVIFEGKRWSILVDLCDKFKAIYRKGCVPREVHIDELRVVH